MIFATDWFFVFAAIFFPLFWLLSKPVPRGVALLCACALFHWHFAGPAGVLPIIILGTITYVCAATRRRWACRSAIVLCVAALVFYKYTLFLGTGVLGAIAPGVAEAALRFARPGLPALPPLGLSFFVFEFVHYLIEVDRGGTPLRRPGEFALFAIFFPSLVAGPIKRYRDFIPSLHHGFAGVGPVDASDGLQRVAVGFFKKLVLADNLTLVITSYQNSFTALPAGEAWLFLAALAARIYFDFSGYSDIAIGLARMLGVRLPENFNFPYIATSLQDFWQRWHISLSSWIRDYIYIPLGGSRHGPARRVFNGLVALTLCGAWHGAAWHYVLWGFWHGAGLAVNASYRSVLGPLGTPLGRVFERWPILGWLLTLPFVMFGWLLFFYELPTAWAMALKLLSFR
jgi:alginate O-acetyltransferase complex protein AlgI